MSNVGPVYYNNIIAGRLERQDDGYVARYDDAYLADRSLPAIALPFPKSQREYRSPALFPFFFGLLAEGKNNQLQCALLKIVSSSF